jgi:hypothetical protein
MAETFPAVRGSRFVHPSEPDISMKSSEKIENPVAADLRQLIEEVGGKFDPRFGKAAGIATAAILAAGAEPKELRKAGKMLRRKVKDAMRFVRKHPWESAALLIVSGAATMKAMEAHDGAKDDDGSDVERPRVKRAPKTARQRRVSATRH